MNRLAAASVGLAAILVGILSLIGVRPMNTRATEIALGTVSLALGVALLMILVSVSIGLLTGRDVFQETPMAALREA